jgi:tetratricopeptide (TPR) repeat protein
MVTNLSLKMAASGLACFSLLAVGLPGFCEDNDAEDIKSAIFRYQAATGQNPSNPLNHVKLGKAYLMSNETDKAIESFKTAIKLNSEDPEVYMGLARCYGRKGDVNLACDNIKEAVRLAPTKSAYHLKYAQLLSRNDKKLDQALQEFKTAIKLDGKDASAHRDYGAALGLKGDFAGQIAEEKIALTLTPDSADAHFYLGSAYAAQGKVKEAQQYLQRCVELDKKNADAYRLLAGIMASKGQYKEAIEYAQSAVNIHPDNKAYASTLEKIRVASKTK